MNMLIGFKTEEVTGEFSDLLKQKTAVTILLRF